MSNNQTNEMAKNRPVSQKSAYTGFLVYADLPAFCLVFLEKQGGRESSNKRCKNLHIPTPPCFADFFLNYYIRRNFADIFTLSAF